MAEHREKDLISGRCLNLNFFLAVKLTRHIMGVWLTNTNLINLLSSLHPQNLKYCVKNTFASGNKVCL